MRIAQIVADGAPEYERKMQRIDRAALSEGNEVELISLDQLRESTAAVAHIYGPASLSRAALRGVSIPYVASGRPGSARFPFRAPTQPAHVITPLRDGAGTFVPEAVEDSYFGVPRDVPATPTIGSFARPGVRNMIEQTMARIHRFREDIEWHVFDAPPSPAEIASVSVWVDPAVDESDYDGFVAEALACGVTPVAARTPVNVQRLEKGRTGILVPPHDPNEMTHAILAALFKPEATRERARAALQTVSKFRARQRLKTLLPLYEQLIQ